MIILFAFIAASMLYGCSEQEVVPTEEVDRIEYKDTPEGGLSDREGCLGC